MASIGHALLGDKIYGAECGGIERAALHAYRVKLMQPFSGEEIPYKSGNAGRYEEKDESKCRKIINFVKYR